MAIYVNDGNGNKVCVQIIKNGISKYRGKIFFKKYIKKPSHFPKLSWNSIKEAKNALKKMPGFIESDKRLNFDKRLNRESSKKPKFYGNNKQLQRDLISQIATNELKNFNKVTALTFPGEYYSDNNTETVESKLRTNLNATVFGLECNAKIYKELNRYKKIRMFKIKDSDFFEKIPIKFDFLWLDYFGTFEGQKLGLINCLKNDCLNDNGVIALTYCLNDRQGKIIGDENSKMNQIERKILSIAKKYNKNFSLILKQKYSNNDVKDLALPMVTFIFKNKA